VGLAQQRAPKVARGGNTEALLTGEEGTRQRAWYRVAFDGADGGSSKWRGGDVARS
jgi:hypothetical protein